MFVAVPHSSHHERKAPMLGKQKPQRIGGKMRTYYKMIIRLLVVTAALSIGGGFFPLEAKEHVIKLAHPNVPQHGGGV
jgi:hypothetical protein